MFAKARLELEHLEDRCYPNDPLNLLLDRDRIEKRVQEIQPTAKERRFDDIGWVSSIRAAERLAKEKERPVFLFSNVGQMDTGRC